MIKEPNRYLHNQTLPVIPGLSIAAPESGLQRAQNRIKRVLVVIVSLIASTMATVKTDTPN